MRKINSILIGMTMISIIGLTILGCSADKKKAEQKADTLLQKESGQSSSEIDSVGGICWNMPSNWQPGMDNPMRAYSYNIAPIDTNEDGAECAVFFFEGGQGGSVQSNLDRWINQMQQPQGRRSAEPAQIVKMIVNNLSISTVSLSGTYQGVGSPMGQTKELKVGYRLNGAIVEGPQGLIFFKMIGPEKTVMAAAADFMRMLHSIRKTGQ
jgi:hypothetical protein